MSDYTTASGHRITFGDISTLVFDWNDVEIHTRNINRYNGAVEWKLIQHLALCVKLAQYYYPDDALIAAQVAVHDFHEIYVGDMVSGLKNYCPDFKDIELHWEYAVHKTLGIPMSNNGSTKHIDLLALVLETYYTGAVSHTAIRENLAKVQWDTDPKTLEHSLIYAETASLALEDCFNLVRHAVVRYQTMLEKVNE